MSDGESKAASTGGNRAPEEIREEIEETREELGDTVAAMTEKTDVKKQAQGKVDDVKAKAQELSDKAKAASPDTPAEGIQQAQSLAKQNPALAIAGVLVGLMVLWRLLRR